MPKQVQTAINQATPIANRARDHAVVIIPAFNECHVIDRVVRSVLQRGYKVIVIDDGSTDATFANAEAAGAILVRHPINLGQGAGIQSGIEFALNLGAQYILTFDADGQHLAEDLDAMLAPLASGTADFTLGSRTLGTAVNMPRFRKLLNQAAIWLDRLTIGKPLTDSHNGFRGMTRRGAKLIRLRHNRMAHASEIVRQIVGSQLPFTEVPVTIRYSRYSLHKGQNAWGMVRIIADLAAARIRR